MTLPNCTKCMRGFSIAKQHYDVTLSQIFGSLTLFLVLGVSTWWLLLGQDRWIQQKKLKIQRNSSSNSNSKSRKQPRRSSLSKGRKHSNNKMMRSPTQQQQQQQQPPKVIRIKEDNDDCGFSSSDSSAPLDSEHETTTVDTSFDESICTTDRSLEPAKSTTTNKKSGATISSDKDNHQATKKKKKKACIGFDNPSKDSIKDEIHPSFQDQQQEQTQLSEKPLYFSILNTAAMTGDDALIVCRQLEQLTCVHRATINLVTSKLTVRFFTQDNTASDQISKVLEKLHIQVKPVSGEETRRVSFNVVGPIQPPARKVVASSTFGPIQPSRPVAPPPGFASVQWSPFA
mmetsp:Transcript_24621/g.37428  ORF Transcript_24621/g.37428 Transcript_24621/m.37428 type:complete len:344 (+) Transcript_24621:175-1206(+)